jgi:hypothetical protein
MSRRPAKVTQAEVARAVRLVEASNLELPTEDEWYIKGDVYFIACGAWIKIGFATKLAERLKALQMANPERLTVLHTVRGTLQSEYELHRKFSALRGLGEWFRAEPELLAYIEEIKAKP